MINVSTRQDVKLEPQNIKSLLVTLDSTGLTRQLRTFKTYVSEMKPEYLIDRNSTPPCETGSRNPDGRFSSTLRRNATDLVNGAGGDGFGVCWTPFDASG